MIIVDKQANLKHIECNSKGCVKLSRFHSMNGQCSFGAEQNRKQPPGFAIT